MAFCITGCATPPESVKGVEDEDPAVRIRAIKIAQQAGDQTVVASLVKQLADEDSAVRFYAISALRKMTGEDFGYRYYDREDVRKPAVERWNVWLAGAATRPTVVDGK